MFFPVLILIAWARCRQSRSPFLPSSAHTVSQNRDYRGHAHLTVRTHSHGTLLVVHTGRWHHHRDGHCVYTLNICGRGDTTLSRKRHLMNMWLVMIGLGKQGIMRPELAPRVRSLGRPDFIFVSWDRRLILPHRPMISKTDVWVQRSKKWLQTIFSVPVRLQMLGINAEI